jgi:hypothetical protein
MLLSVQGDFLSEADESSQTQDTALVEPSVFAATALEVASSSETQSAQVAFLADVDEVGSGASAEAAQVDWQAVYEEAVQAAQISSALAVFPVAIQDSTVASITVVGGLVFLADIDETALPLDTPSTIGSFAIFIVDGAGGQDSTAALVVFPASVIATAATQDSTAVAPSVFNAPVIEQAAACGVAISFRDHARVGIPVTLVSLAVLAAWIAFLSASPVF